MSKVDIDYDAAERVSALVEQVRANGLAEAAKVFDRAYWGWLRTVNAYVAAHPYVGQPEPGMTPISALSVTDFTIRHWAPLIPGSPMIDDEAVMRAAADDEAWHRAEDRQMRIDAGEDGL
jgi:hypothetical protein